MARNTSSLTVTYNGTTHLVFATGTAPLVRVENPAPTAPAYTPAVIVADHATTPAGTTFSVEVGGKAVTYTKQVGAYWGDNGEHIAIPYV
ncbi:MAG: hypothetical protein M0Z46_10460 [Actinomycetota bacterium]|jgi:hypothetical protein|nr:hypothetical protein [Actinomycetota bacterium]